MKLIPTRSILINLLLAALAVILVLGAGELGFRVFLPPPPLVRALPGANPAAGSPEKPGARRTERGPAPRLYVMTPAGRRLRPDARILVEHHPTSGNTLEINTNSLGYRNPELGAKERTRVLFLGDSITLEDFLPEEETFVREVEELSRTAPRPLETVNAGVGGIGLADELAILMETGLKTSPDAVVIDFYLNDAQPSPGIELIQVPRWLETSYLARYFFASVSRIHWKYVQGGEQEIRRRQLSEWYQEVLRRYPPGPGNPARDPGAFNALILGDIWDWGSAWSDGAWNNMRPLFSEFRRLSDRNHFRLFLVAFPLREQVVAEFPCDDPQRRLVEVGRNQGIPVLDLLPAFRADWRATHRQLFYDGCHHNPEGSRFVAERILEFLERGLS